MSAKGVLPVATAVLLGMPAEARNSIYFYRYDLPTPSCAQDSFKGELNPTARMYGPYHRVETDSEGRLLSSELMRQGKPLGGYTIRYAGKGHGMVEWTLFSAGRPTSIQKCVRDAKGRMARVEIRTPAGVLTEIQRLSPAYSPSSGGREGWIGYTPGGKIKRKETDFFNGNGVLIMVQARFVGDGKLHQTMFDPDTGLVQQRQLFELATHKLLRTDKYTYERNGDRLKSDIYDGAGKQYGLSDYATGLELRRQYRRADGSTEEYRYGYDERRHLTDAALTVSGKPVCRLVYVRTQDGAISKTEVRGPDGSLWADYPGREVQELTRNGHDPSGGNSKILRHGNWW